VFLPGHPEVGLIYSFCDREYDRKHPLLKLILSLNLSLRVALYVFSVAGAFAAVPR